MNLREAETAAIVANINRLDPNAKLVCSQFEFYPRTGKINTLKKQNKLANLDKKNLFTLMLQPDIVTSRNCIYSNLKNNENSNSDYFRISSSIRRIRNAFYLTGINPEMIETVREHGYKFSDADGPLKSYNIEIPTHEEESDGISGNNFNLQTFELDVDEEKIPLTNIEATIYLHLLKERDNPVTHADLVDRAWGIALDKSNYAALRVHIARIRKKTRSRVNPETINIINVHNVGYMLKAS